MRVTSVEIHPANSANAIELSFRDPRRLNPYNVKAIVGLDADEITQHYYGGSGSENAAYYELSLKKREIVVRIELNPSFLGGESYSDLRDNLYRLISSSRTGMVQLQFKDGDDVVASISGFVSKFESPHFAKTQEVQITIGCENPLLRSPDPIITDVSGLDPALTTVTDSLSTAPHGFTLGLNVLANIMHVIISDPGDSNWMFDVFLTPYFIPGDVIHLSSEYNNKAAYLDRSGTIIQLGNNIMPTSVWPILFPGDNNFELAEPASLEWDYINYYPTYWGV